MKKKTATLPVVMFLGLLAPIVLFGVLWSRSVKRVLRRRFATVSRVVGREIERWQ